MRGILEAMHDYPDEALGLCFFLIDVYKRQRIERISSR